MQFKSRHPPTIYVRPGSFFGVTAPLRLMLRPRSLVGVLRVVQRCPATSHHDTHHRERPGVFCNMKPIDRDISGVHPHMGADSDAASARRGVQCSIRHLKRPASSIRSLSSMNLPSLYF